LGYWLSLEWLALIVSFAYPTVGYFLAGGAACSLALALDDREMGGYYATMKCLSGKLGTGMYGIKVMNHEKFTCGRASRR